MIENIEILSLIINTIASLYKNNIVNNNIYTSKLIILMIKNLFNFC